MKNKTRKALLGSSLLLGAVLLTGCTKSFCSPTDKAAIAYPYDRGVTIYYDPTVADDSFTLPEGAGTQVFPGNEHVYKYVPTTTATYNFVSYDVYGAAKASLINSTVKSAVGKGHRIPTSEYWSAIDDFVLQASVVQAAGFDYEFHYDSEAHEWVDSYQIHLANHGLDAVIGSLTASTPGTLCVNPYTAANTSGKGATAIENRKPGSDEYSILREYGKTKFSGERGENYGYLANWINYLSTKGTPGLGSDGVPGKDFLKLYKNAIKSKVSAVRSCIATSNGYFGHYGAAGDWEVAVQKKSWGYAFTKGGFLEGLIVYPVAWLVDQISYGIDSGLTGVGQILAIVIVTVLIRGLMMAATWKSTMAQQKMQSLQPQLAKLQQKYPNSDTNQAEKQRMAQEQMALYKRNGINPMSSILTMFIQFPVFICVWSALQGSSALATGSFLNLALSDTIQSVVFNFKSGWAANATGWWTALILFILMAGTQTMAMLLPQIMTKKANKNVTKLGKSAAADKSGKQMRMMTWIMLIFTIVMGFMLPSAMGVYWLIGGLISMVQTLITQSLLAKKKK